MLWNQLNDAFAHHNGAEFIQMFNQIHTTTKKQNTWNDSRIHMGMTALINGRNENGLARRVLLSSPWIFNVAGRWTLREDHQTVSHWVLVWTVWICFCSLATHLQGMLLWKNTPLLFLFSFFCFCFFARGWGYTHFLPTAHVTQWIRDLSVAYEPSG